MGWIEPRCRCRTKADRKVCRCPASVKSYRAGYRAGADKIQETFPNRAQAIRWLRAQEGQLATGLHVDPRGGRVLFADWAAEWELTRTGKPAAVAASRGRLHNHLLPTFGSLPLDGISPVRVRQWVARLAGEELAPKTVRHCHGLLHSILADAIDNRLLTSNPCVGTQLPEAVRDDPVFLSADELRRLIEAVPDHWRALVVLLAGTGLRWGEAVGLRARWLDLPHSRLSVRWQWSDGYGWQPAPKTKHSRRTVILSASVVEELTVLWGQATGEAPVFTAPHGGPVRHSAFTRREKRGDRQVLGPWWRAVAKAGLEEKHPTPHDLRHTHASLLIAANVPLTAIQRRLGHKTIATTSDLYGHLAEPTNVGLLAAVEGALTSPDAAAPPRSSQQHGAATP